MNKTKKKSFIGWIYDDEDLEFKSLSAWSGSPSGLYICLLEHKKSLGKFKGHKVKLTLEEVPNEKG